MAVCMCVMCGAEFTNRRQQDTQQTTEGQGWGLGVGATSGTGISDNTQSIHSARSLMLCEGVPWQFGMAQECAGAATKHIDAPGDMRPYLSSSGGMWLQEEKGQQWQQPAA